MNAMGLPGRLRASKTAWMPSLPSPATASPSRTADAIGQRISRPNRLLRRRHAGRVHRVVVLLHGLGTSSIPSGRVDGAMVAHVKLGALAVQLRLTHVAPRAKPGEVAEAVTEDRADKEGIGRKVSQTTRRRTSPQRSIDHFRLRVGDPRSPGGEPERAKGRDHPLPSLDRRGARHGACCLRTATSLNERKMPVGSPYGNGSARNDEDFAAQGQVGRARAPHRPPLRGGHVLPLNLGVPRGRRRQRRLLARS